MRLQLCELTRQRSYKNVTIYAIERPDGRFLGTLVVTPHGASVCMFPEGSGGQLGIPRAFSDLVQAADFITEQCEALL